MRGIQIWVFCIFCLLFSGFYSVHSLAQVTVEVLSPRQEAEPGDFVTHSFLITNNGPNATFDLELDLTEGLSTLGLPSSIQIKNGESIPVILTLVVSTTTRAGVNEVTLVATSQSSSAITDNATAFIDVIEIASVEVLAPNEIRIQAGTTIGINFVVMNTGNSINEFEIEVDTDSQLNVTVEPALINLLPGESKLVMVMADVPENIVAQFVSIVITVTSTTSSDVKLEMLRIIEILPPGPEFFSTNLNLEIPLQLNTSIGKSINGALHDLDIAATGSVSLELPDGPNLGVRVQGFGGDNDPTQVVVDIGFSDFLISVAAGEEFFADLSLDPLSVSVVLAGGDQLYLANLFTTIDGLTVAGSFAATKNEAGLRTRMTSQFVSPISQFLTFQFNIGLLSEDPFGEAPDEKNVGVRIRFNEPRLTIAAGIELQEQNTKKDPKFPISSTLSSELQTRITLERYLPMFTFEITNDLNRGLGPGSLFPINNSFTTLLFKAEQNLIDALRVEWISKVSLIKSIVSSEDFTLVENSLGMDLDLGLIGFTARFQSDQNIDNVRQFTDSVSGVSATVEIFESPVSLSLSIQSFFNGLSNTTTISRVSVVDINFGYRVNGISLGASGGFELGNSETMGANLSFQFASQFDFPTSIPGKGQIEGHVFADENGNGRRDEGEVDLPDIILQIGGFRVITGSNEGMLGFYRSPPIQPGTFFIDLAELPTNLTTGIETPIEVTIRAGQRKTMDIPLIPVSGIEGIVFNDLDQDGELDGNEPGLGAIALLLTGEHLDEPNRIRTNSTGQFFVPNLPAGEYTVVLDESTLPERFALTTPRELTFNLQIAERRSVAFGAFQRPQTIMFSPDADFSFEPQNPVVGQTVHFDASNSIDFDGQIISYEWDFNGDSIIDAKGMVVEHIFEVSDTFTVLLMVTDNDNLIGIHEVNITVTDP